MSPEEKQTILQFMGQTYGLSHKLDQDIVGHSQYLKPSSSSIREKFEEVLHTPIRDTQREHITEPKYTTLNTPSHIEQPNTIPAPIFNIPEQHISSLSEVDNSQLVDILEKINLNLIRIGDILERASNGRPKKIKNTGSE
jgi:hypothetical protein